MNQVGPMMEIVQIQPTLTSIAHSLVPNNVLRNIPITDLLYYFVDMKTAKTKKAVYIHCFLKAKSNFSCHQIKIFHTKNYEEKSSPKERKQIAIPNLLY